MKIFNIMILIASVAISGFTFAGGIKTSTANRWLDNSEFGKSCKSETALKTPTKNNPFGSSYHYDIWGTGCSAGGTDFIKHKTHVDYKDIPYLYINSDGDIRVKPN